MPLAELLLTKLQIVELNEKDVRDTLLLVHGHEVADRDGDAINGARDRRAVRGRLGPVADDHGERRDGARARGALPASADDDRAADERRACARYSTASRPSRRPAAGGCAAKIGERKRWYELPEEVE